MRYYVEWLNAQADIGNAPAVPISNLMYLVWLDRPDLQAAFDLHTEEGRKEFVLWFRVSAKKEYGIGAEFIPTGNCDRIGVVDSLCVSVYNQLVGMESGLRSLTRLLPGGLRRMMVRLWRALKYSLIKRGAARDQGIQELVLPDTPVLTQNPKPAGKSGVNLIGYVTAELGMGEHVRMTAKALSRTNIPHGLVNYLHGVSSRQRDSLLGDHFLDVNIYRANLLHINADQLLRAFFHFGVDFFENKYNIGYWMWELPRCPDEWKPLLGFVQEIWAPSTFVREAFSAKTSIPVIQMPLCVEFEPPDYFKRGDFRLPEGKYLFLFTFDFYSFIDRKNPFACIEAFKRAFIRDDPRVGLVIKAMNGDESSANWKKMLGMVAGDNRIYIINEVLDRRSMLGLIKVCDCYMSLHRSEGFGFGPAEAMFLGKPVIVTNYSGNTDFTRADNSCLVNYQLVPVQAGQYPFHKGQEWADPDIEHAAWHMRQLVEKPSMAQEIGKAGEAYIRQHFNARVVGARYARRLGELQLV